MKKTVLVVDDNDVNRLNLSLLLKEDYDVLEAGDCTEAESCLASHAVGMMVLDLALPPEPDNPEIGLHYLEQLSKDNPDIPVIVITGHNEKKIATRAKKLGALDFFTKPFHPDEVRDTIDAGMVTVAQRLREEQEKNLGTGHFPNDLLGHSQAIQTLNQIIAQVAPTPSTVLIRGETGCGKELVARKIHQLSNVSDGPFVVVNCVATDPSSLEIELFGQERSATAGDAPRKLGWFERAAGGTILLDEIGGLPLDIQGRLLRVLETGEFSRLGGSSQLKNSARILCSTKQNIEQLVEENRFRDDLYYRIHVINIDTPPLRQRKEDIPMLSEYFLTKKSLLCNRKITGISEDVLNQFSDYDWPGNVRELENVIERAVVLSVSDHIEQLPSALSAPRTRGNAESLMDQYFDQLSDEGIDAEKLLMSLEKRLLEQALKRTAGVKVKAGRWMGFGDRAKDKMRYLCDKYDVMTQEE